jgi:hypothetical protein
MHVLIRPSTLRRRIASLAQTPREFLALGDDLRRLRDAYTDKFVAIAEECGIKRRTAFYLAEVAERAAAFPKRRAQISRIGWTKAQIVLPAMTKENADELLAYAEAHTARELRAWIRPGRAKKATRCVLLYFTEREYDQVSAALIKSGAKRRGRGLAGMEGALLEIVRATPSFPPKRN